MWLTSDEGITGKIALDLIFEKNPSSKEEEARLFAPIITQPQAQAPPTE